MRLTGETELGLLSGGLKQSLEEFGMARRKAPDPKLDALRKHNSLHHTPEKVRDELFSSQDFFDARDLVQVRYEMLRRVRVDEQSISEVAGAFGVSRPTFYQALRAFESEGVLGLLPQKPGPRRAHKLDDNVVGFLEKCLAKDDGLKAADLALLVQNQLGLAVHPRSIERALARRKKKTRR